MMRIRGWNKKSMMKVGAGSLILVVFTIIFIFIIIPILSSSPLEKTSYNLGEKVRINLRNYGSYSLKIITPSTTHEKKGINNVIMYTLDEIGNYSIIVREGKNIEEYNFSVIGLINDDSDEDIFDEDLVIEEIFNESNIRVGKPVKWVKKTNIAKGTRRTKVDIPTNSLNVSLYKNSVRGRNIVEESKSKVVNSTTNNDKKSVIITDLDGDIEVEYYTKAPNKEEKIISGNKKEVLVYSSENYSDVIAYTDVMEVTNNKKYIKVFWKEENKNIDFEAKDLDFDGLIDNIEWVVPHLSNQTFEIIVITKAEHLNSSRGFISDIYDKVKEKDDDWSEEINDGEYVRVTFENNLTSSNDITIFPRIVSGDPKVFVYEVDGVEILAEFNEIVENSYNKVFLNNLGGTQDSFDLLILNGTIEFDHIIDPVSQPSGEVELRVQECKEQGQEASQNNFPTFCEDGSYPNACGSGSDHMSCNDIYNEFADTDRSGAIYRWGGIRIETYNSTILDCDSIDEVFLCYEFWGASAKHDCFVGVNSDGDWNDTAVTCEASAPGVTCIDVTSEENWDCLDFFGSGDGTRAQAKSQAHMISGSGSQTWSFDVLFFNVSYTAADITPPVVTIDSPTNGNSYGVSDLPLYFNVTLNENGRCLYSLDSGNTNLTMTTSGGSLYGLVFNATNLSIDDGNYTFKALCNDTAGKRNDSQSADFSYDETAPSMSYTVPSESTGVYRNRNYILVNVSANDSLTGLNNITIRFYNTSDNLLYINITGESPFYVNYSNLLDGVYYYNSSSNDSVGNIQNLETRNITLDTTYPKILYEPQTNPNGKSIRGNSIYVNVTVNETNEVNITYLLYNITGQVFKNTFTNGQRDVNWTPLIDGNYSYNVTIVDIVDLVNATETRLVILDNVKPLLIVNDPSFNGVNLSGTSVLFNITLNEYGGDVYYSLDNGGTNNSMSSSDNLTYTATNSSIDDLQYTVNFYLNDSAGNRNDSVSQKFGIDNVIPGIVITNPTPINYTIDQIDINFSTSDDNSGIDSCWYSVDFGNTNTSIDNCLNTSITSPQGSVVLIVYTNDTAGNINFTENVSFYVDSVYPDIEYDSNTRPNASSFENPWIYVNVTVVENNFSNITYMLFNETSGGTEVNITTYTSLDLDINWTGLNNDNIDYYYNVTVVDTLGNTNYTQTRTLTLTPGDVQGPVIIFISPVSQGAYINESSILFNISLDENGSYVYYSLDNGGINFSMSTIDNIYYDATNSSISDGIYTLDIFTNDTIGNPSNKSRNFTIDTVIPLIEYVSSDYDLVYDEDIWNYSGSPTNPSSSIDNDFLTFARVDSTGGVDILYFNYSIPIDLQTVKLEYLADWEIFDGTFECYNSTSSWDNFASTADNVRTNVSIPSQCYQGGIMQLRLYRSLTPGEAGWVNFYEQQVFWNISPVTPGDNSNLSSDFIYINVKADEINEANITFLLHNSTGEVNTTTYISVVRAINITNLPDGNYTYNVTIFDLATSFNTTNTYTITLDTNNPSANLSIPANNTITNETNYNLTVNISDNIEIDNITLYIYNSSDSVINETNFNLSDAQMFFGVIYVFADGIFEWFYRIIDIAGNYVYTQNYTITVDSTYPDIEFGTGTNASGTEDEREWIYVNVSFTEDNFVNVTYTLYNDTSGATQINKTTFDSQVYTINWTNLSSLNVTYFYNVTIVDLTSNRNSTSTNTLKLIDITNPGIILSDPDNQTYDYNTSIPISIIVNDTHLDSCKYTLNNGVTNTSIPDCRSSSFSVADNQSYMLIVYVNDSLGQSNSTNISFFVDTTSIETLDYQVQRGQIAIDGKKSITIEKSDPRKSFSLIDIRSENHTSDSLYYTVTPSSNYTALTFENYDKTSTVSWEYITGPGISAERGEVAYNESDTGFEVTITEIDITESFIIINNRLDSAANDAYSQGLWSARFFNDSTIIINRSQSSSAGNVSWQIVELNGASIQRGNSRIIGIFNSSVLTSAVNLSRSVLFMSSRVSDAGQIIEDSNSSLSTIIFGSVSSGSLSDTYESDGTAYDILATPGYLLNTTFIFNTNSPSGVNNFNISVRWNQVGTAGAPTTTAQIYNFFNNSWESLSNIVISAKVYEDDTQTITNNVLNYVNSSGSILVMFQHDHSSTAKRYNILFDYIDVDFNVTTAANAASTFIGGRFENETLLSFYREDSEGTVDIEWHIVEWDRFKVDRNNLDVTGTDSVYNSTSKLINRSKSFRSTFFSSSGSENYNADSMLSSFIFNTTDIEFKKGTSSETQNVSWQVIEIVERNNPVVDLKSPLNSSQLDSSVIIGFNFSVNDSSQMDNCSLYGDWSSGWHLNQTIISPEKVSELNFSSIDVVNDGTYLWNVLCYDLYGNLAFNNTNYSFTVDSTYPWIEYNLQTISNNSNLSQNWIYVNVTVNESNEANITYLLHNSSGQIFKNTFTTPQRLINWTPLINQYYTFNVTVTDTFNNKNTTGNRFVILDTTFPGIKINTPLNNTNTSTSLQNLTVNLTDNFEFDNATLFVINSSDSIINQTIWNLSGNVYYLGINYNFSYDGSFKWFYKVSDIAGNLNESNNFTITIDSTIPLIDYGVGTLANNSNVSQSFIYVNVTVNETNEVNITFKLHNSSGEVNETIYPDENRDINWTTLPDGNYTFNVTIVDLVLNSNSTGTYFITLDTTEPSGNLSVPLNLSYTDSTSQNLTVNVSDNIELDNATLFVINSSDSIINTTVYNMSGPEYFLGIVYEFLYDGVFQWFYRIFDIGGNSIDTSNFTITIDTVYPLIDYGVGTLANNSNVSQNFIYVNVTVNETNEVNVTFGLYNNSGDVNVTTKTDESRTINWTGLIDGNYSYNVSIYDESLQYNFSETRFITLDTTNPSGNLSVPLNLSYTNVTTQNMTINVTDAIELDNATMFIINSSETIINQTVFNLSGPEYFLGIVYEFLYDGVFQWFYRIFDIGGNSIDSSNYTITIDTIIPETIFGVGTEISNLNFSRNWIYVNVSVNETNEANVTFGLYNLTNDVNVTTFYDGTRVVNWTNLDDAIYYYNVTTYDLSNQINYTETREIWLDDTGPTIIIDHPQPKTYGYNTSLPFNFSVNDNLVGRSGCWWNVDESTNQSIDCDTNTTFNSTEGEHTLYMYSNDSLNNLASNNVTFSISTLGPATTLNYPNNNRFLNYTGWVLFNYSVVDPDGVDLCRLYGNWSGSWDINDSNSSVINDSLNYFNESINSEGTYIWNIWCNDSLSLESFALNNFTFGLDETIPLIEFGIGTQDTYYNLSQNFIYVNVSVNETNEANITFGLYNSSGDVNVTVFTDGTRTINWTTLGDGNYSYNVSIYDKAINYNFTETRNLTLNTIDPSGNLSIPLNLSYDNVTSKNLTVNMSDNIELDNATLFVINSSDSIINTTIQNLSGTEYFLGIVYEFLYDGVFQWFYRIFDIGGNSIDTGNYTYTLDTIIPGIFFGVGTQDNYSNLSQNFIYVNVSVNETNEANITFGLYNSSGDVNITIFTDLTRTINWTGLSDGNYSYNVSIYDESLQFNFTETRDITLDTTPSEVTLNFPQNTSYNYTNILFNVSTNEISYCNYSVDLGSTNYSMNTTDNFNFNSTQNLTGGNYSVIYYCYDLLNNLNNSMNISFTVDFTYPLIEYSGGTLGNNSNVSQSFIFVNVTVNETNEVNISFRLHDSDSQVNLTTYTDNGRTINWTGLNDGNYSFNVTTTDIVSNINTTETRYVILDDTYPNANLSLPLNGSITGDTIQNLTVNLSDNIELDNATLFVINSSDSIINQTAFNLSSSIYFLGIVYNFSYDGDFEWFYRVVDIAGNSNDTENFSITIDTSFPGVEFGFGTQLAGANLTDDFIYVNVSVNENNEANITFRLFNSTNTVNTTNYSTPVRTINWTNLPNEKYRYDVTVYDTFDRMNATELRTINLDNTNPNANLSTPLNETFTGITTQNLTVNLSDNIELDNATLFILNSSDSIINQTTQNLSGTTYFLGIIYEFLYDGLFQWFYRVFDISGNFIDTSNYTIRLDTAFPQIEFSDTTENNYSNVSQNNVFIQVSVVEGNEVNITFLLHNSSGQVFKNTFTNQQRIINWTPLINGNYSYNVTVVDSSDQVNFTETRIITLDTNGPNITNVGDTPDPIIWSENLSISSNITDSLLYVNFVFVELNGSNYTMNFMGGDHYKAIINTSNLNFTIIYNYTVYSNDSINNFNNQTGQVKVVQELNNPQINWINDTPDPVTFGSNFNVTANVTDDVNVTLVWVEIGGSNYTMLNYTNSVYNVTVSSLNVGIGNYNYTVYAKDNSENINSSVGNITINEGSFINDVVVRAANPDPIDNIHQGRYSVVIFNPSNNSVNITSVNINATSATGDVWDEITLGSNNSYPETGWSLSGTKLVSWSGLYVLNGGDAIGFFVNISSDDTGETFNISYDATINGTLYVDPHSHNTLESSTGGTPFVQLSFNTTGSWYNDSIKGNNNKTIYISLIESSNDGQIPNDVQMTIVVPEEFSNIVNVGGTGWGVPNITDNIIIVNTTQIVQSGLITYAFNVTAPAGSAAQGLYLLTASLAGADARAEFEGAIKVFDGIAPEIIIYEPSDLQNVSGHIVNPFNYSVSDSSSLLSCSLYGNWSGSFEINQTVSTPVRDTVNNFSYVDVTNDGLYIWNIECSDIYGNTGFFTTNFTFGSYLIPTEVSLFNISQTNNNGTGNITLVWNASNSTFKYLIYQSDEINGSFSLVNETTSNNYTDTNFSGLMRRFYRVDSWNPIGQNNTGRLFGSHVYTLRHNGNTRNWLGFPTNFSYLKFANETLSEITNATSVSMINVTNQKKITCNLYSCPSSIECTDSNCNFSFNMGSGLSYEVNINSSAPGEINWSGVGIVNNPIDIDLVKNSSSYGKNWISMYANTTLKGAKNISDNISNMETITIWNSSSQRSIGLIKNPFLGLPYLGIDFTFNMEDGFEVSVNASETWTQI